MISVQFPSLLFAVISSKANNNFRCLLWARLIHTRIQFVRYEFSMTTSSLIRKFPFVLLMPDDNVKNHPPPLLTPQCNKDAFVYDYFVITTLITYKSGIWRKAWKKLKLKIRPLLREDTQKKNGRTALKGGGVNLLNY